MNDDDLQWRRPPESTGPTPGRPPAPREPAAPPPYSGPPRTTPPPPACRPRMLVQPPPPRDLPAQDLATLAAQARKERTLTYGAAMLAGAVLLSLVLPL